MQLTYTNDKDLGLPGQLADDGDNTVASKVNPSVAIPFGCAVTAGTDPDRDVKLPTTLAEAKASLGIALATQAMESSDSGDPQYPVKRAVNVIKKGRVIVKVTTAVTAGKPAFVRYATGVDDDTITQKGSIGGLPDGAAQVMTLTPAAANNENYSVSVFDKHGKLVQTAQVTSDGDGTATEICTALRAALSPAGITLGGTDTLTLTADVAGEGFSVEASSNIAIVETTANSQTAAELEGSEFLTSASADGLAVLELNLPA